MSMSTAAASPRRPAPRPILKFSYSCGPPASYPVAPAASARSASHEPFASASGPPTPSRGVHFPPSPRLTRTFSTHPPSDYDRSPIVVGPNTCALPERGGRTYTEEYAQGGDYLSARDGECMRNGEYLRSTRTDARASDTAYPRALPCYAPCPPLTPDASSESDDSDACASPPPVPAAATFGGMARPGHGLSVDLSISSALAFLPHPSPKTPLTPTTRTDPHAAHVWASGGAQGVLTGYDAQIGHPDSKISAPLGQYAGLAHFGRAPCVHGQENTTVDRLSAQTSVIGIFATVVHRLGAIVS
ncbi:hypothetical protein BD626DRAFT_541469 [Schizophyllum amplum]|uniref:Uncharacterized protein n=1 Tax=Schizophyllum amplum TaxID=97359 RepID=A0A550BUN8_9AGAR|nr:hypothetical protein BD626DRAFT_541469 [Auriculariopsis ampla]